MKRISQWSNQTILALALFVCSVILVLSGRAIRGYSTGFHNMEAVAISLVLAVGLALFFVWLCGKLPDRGRRVSVLLFLAILGAQVFFLVMVSRPMSMGDPARVQDEALAMLRYQKGQMNPKNIYLQNYHNNHFIVILFYYFYKILDMAGITKVWIPTIILNVVCIDCGIYFTYAGLKKVKGIAAANMVLFLFLLCPTTYLWLASVYTNTISFPFIMGILYLGLDMRKDFFSGRFHIKYLILGVLTVMGCFVRPTTVISVIALVLYHIICYFQDRRKKIPNRGIQPRLDIRLGSIRKSAIRVILLFLVCGITWLGCSKVIARHVDAGQFTEKFPVEHWLMMGMNEKSEGGYWRPDRMFTASLQGLDAKRKGDREQLVQRLCQMGVSGVANQFSKKLTRVWAQGDDDGVGHAKFAYHYPPLYEKILGQGGTWFIFYMQAFRIAMFFLIVCGLFRQLRAGKCTPVFLYAVTLLGAVCFFLLWEAGKRYNICFNGVCLFLMAEGSYAMRQWLGRANGFLVKAATCGSGEKKRLWSHIFQTVFLAGTVCLLAVGFYWGGSYRGGLARKYAMYYQCRLGTDIHSIDWWGIKRADVLEQTIEQEQKKCRNGWNRLRIYFANRDVRGNNAEYRAELVSLEDNKVIYTRKIRPRNIGDKGYFVIRADGKKTSQVGYKLRLTHIGKSYNLIPMVCKFPLLDPYPYGSLSVNGKEKNWDLAMGIYEMQE